ncbi:MAG: ATP-binding protein [Succinivibrionaceae bacterium]|nr:ATP-binding protein [Succinivibrionaceae bacterium]
MALLWQLVKNGALDKGSILFWEEPEANIGPARIHVVVGLLLELQHRGVQVFVATHDYILASYLEVKKAGDDSIAYRSLSFSDGGGEPRCEIADRFGDLKHNAIVEAFSKLLN